MRIYCSRCGAKLDQNVAVCNNCGRVLDAPTQPNFYCRECDCVVGKEQTHCLRCGSELGSPIPDFGMRPCSNCGKKVHKLFEHDLCLRCAVLYGDGKGHYRTQPAPK